MKLGDKFYLEPKNIPIRHTDVKTGKIIVLTKENYKDYLFEAYEDVHGDRSLFKIRAFINEELFITTRYDCDLGKDEYILHEVKEEIKVGDKFYLKPKKTTAHWFKDYGNVRIKLTKENYKNYLFEITEDVFSNGTAFEIKTNVKGEPIFVTLLTTTLTVDYFIIPVNEEQQLDRCTCSSWELLHFGCQCGYIERNKK